MQTNKTFSISEALQFGWETFKKNPWFWVLVTIIQAILGGIGGNFSSNKDSPPEIMNVNPTLAFFMFILGVVYLVISLGVQLGAIRLELDGVENKVLEYKTLFSKFQASILWRFFAASVLYGLLVALGIVLFIVPGIYWALKYQYYAYFIVDKNAGISESLKMSADLTQGVKMQLLFFGVVNFVLAIVGVMALFVGILVAAPVISLGYAYVFKKLQSQTESMPVTSAPVHQADTVATAG